MERSITSPTSRRAWVRLALSLVAMVGAVQLGCGLQSHAATGMQIHWTDFVQVDGITYLKNAHLGRALRDDDLGSSYAEVRFRLYGNIDDPSYQPVDGDAAYLDTGTKIFSLQGYPSYFRLAARENGQLVVYEADRNPQARSGVDLLPSLSGGIVTAISVDDDQDDSTPALATIVDPQHVHHLALAVLFAHVEQGRQPGYAAPYFVAFHFADGTQSVRAFWPDDDELARGFLVSHAFTTAITSAVQDSAS